jgi:hypothetical protein
MMSVRNLAIGLVALNILAFIFTAILAWFLDRRSVTALFDTATYVGLGIGALGALMFIGSTSGLSSSAGIAASAADQPSRLMDALWGDRSSGIATGALFVLGGILWIGIAWLLAEMFAAHQG